MGKFTDSLPTQPKDAIPGYHPYRRVKEAGKSVKKQMNPKAPEPTDAEVQLQNRQKEELARLDDDENVRIKRGLRGRLGTRMLSSRRTSSRSSMLGGGAAASGGSGGGSGGGGGEGGYSGRTGRGMSMQR
jgi:hypothetical protein